MKNTIIMLLYIVGIYVYNGKISAQTSGSQITFADPTIYFENGKYYLSGTRSQSPKGFSVLESTDLIIWSVPAGTVGQNKMILVPGDNVYGTDGFWAPQILKENNQYYLTYTANEYVAIASSSTLTGTYTQNMVSQIDQSAKNIDSYLFKDDDGKYYLYHVRFNNGNFIWVAEFDFATGKIKSSTLKRCFTNTQAWEKTPAYNSNPIMEGPTVIKMNGLYYLFYSANHFQSIDYAVGYATATSPYGPWTKYEKNPIIHRSIVGENGSGHGDLFFDKNNDPYYVYHVHYSNQAVSPRRTRIVPLDFDIDCNSPNKITVKIKDPKGIIVPRMK